MFINLGTWKFYWLTITLTYENMLISKLFHKMCKYKLHGYTKETVLLTVLGT